MKISLISKTACACIIAVSAPPSFAQGTDTQLAEATNQYVHQTQSWVNGALAQVQSQPNALSGMRMEVSFGALDSRLRLAPCQRVEPYLPVGTKLWGRSKVGLRCLEGAVKWNVFLPVTVKAYGKAWVLNSNIPGGSVLRASDATEAEVDLAEDNSPAVSDPSQWIGSTASRQLASGQAIRQSSIRATSVFVAGSQVRVIAQGSGFSISTDGQALTAGSFGQSVKVKMDGGRIVSGLVVDQNTVRVDL